MAPFAPGLADKIRNKLDHGILPHEASEKMYAGRGRGDVCQGCDQPIEPAQVEYEMEFHDGGSVRLHLACAGFWDAECQRRGYRTLKITA